MVLRLLFLLFFGFSFSLGAETSKSACFSYTEEQKIEILLKKVSVQQATFIRNGESHSAKAAESHLRRKLLEAKSSFFAPDPKDWTAKLFIEKIASKSFLSGKPYLMRWPDGTEVPSGIWLQKELENLEHCSK